MLAVRRAGGCDRSPRKLAVPCPGTIVRHPPRQATPGEGDQRMTSLERFQDLLRTLFQFDCADLDYVNGDSFIPGATPLDDLFKERMFAGTR